MQEIITYVIGVVAAVIIGRWLWRTLRGRNSGGCISCDSCKHHQSSTCQDREGR